MRIAMVSEHASPLAVLGGQDAGGQNVHVAALSRTLAGRGHDVTVYTRRDDPHLPERTQLCAGVQVVHVPAGPASAISKDDMAPFMPQLGHWLARDWRRRGVPDVVHAHFWMSGHATTIAVDQLAAAGAGVPCTAITFHALGRIRRVHQGAADRFRALGHDKLMVRAAPIKAGAVGRIRGGGWQLPLFRGGVYRRPLQSQSPWVVNAQLGYDDSAPGGTGGISVRAAG